MTSNKIKLDNLNESNHERFIRIVERRVNNILDNLDSLGKCSNRKNYDYSEKNVKQIFSAIEKKVKEIKYMFQETSNNKIRFKLKG